MNARGLGRWVSKPGARYLVNVLLRVPNVRKTMDIRGLKIDSTPNMETPPL